MGISTAQAVSVKNSGNWMNGAGGEWFQVGLSLLAYGLILQIVHWMTRNGWQIRQQLKQRTDTALQLVGQPWARHASSRHSHPAGAVAGGGGLWLGWQTANAPATLTPADHARDGQPADRCRVALAVLGLEGRVYASRSSKRGNICCK